MSHDDESTRQRWTQLESSGKNASSNAPESKRFLHSIRDIKFILGHALKENMLTKRIASLLSGERKKKDAFEQL